MRTEEEEIPHWIAEFLPENYSVTGEYISEDTYHVIISYNSPVEYIERQLNLDSEF